MSEIELQIEKLKKEIASLEDKKEQIPTYTFSRIKLNDLDNIIDIEERLANKKFDEWFNSKIDISQDIVEFLENHIYNNRGLISTYNEEDLKLYFLAPIFNHINFKSFQREFRAFYDEKMSYETDKFILKGEVDFMLALGLFKSKKPYFFIQEFKRAEEFSNPRPQLLAEMVAGLEISEVSSFKGAYIIGSIWNFVILEKLGENSYQYFVSENFDSSKIDDLIDIYKNLIYIKNSIV